jgi:hypothetical protein
MDEQKKLVLKNDITMIKAHGNAVVGLVGTIQPAVPIGGPVAVIPALTQLSQAIKMQNDNMVKLMNVVEKMLEEG